MAIAPSPGAEAPAHDDRHGLSLARAVGPNKPYLKGAIFILSAGLLWSTTGTIMRLAPHVDGWQFLLYRCIGLATAVGLYAYWRERRSLIAQVIGLGRAGLVVMLAMSLAMSGFVFALKVTTVANALLLNACSPILSALLGAAILKERITLKVVAAIALGLVGLVVMVTGEVRAGNLYGNLAAFLSALGFAVGGVYMRKSSGVDFTPAVFGFASACGLVAALAVVATGRPLLPGWEALAPFCNGFIFMGLGFVLFTRGAPHIPAAGQTVMAQTETVFGPLWVWLIFAETPLATTLLGGAIVIAAVITMALVGMSAATSEPTAVQPETRSLSRRR